MTTTQILCLVGAAGTAIALSCSTAARPIVIGSGQGGAQTGVPAGRSGRGGVESSPPATYPGYTLVWADEFDRDGPPDPAKWAHERGFVRNQELQWYRPENARV